MTLTAAAVKAQANALGFHQVGIVAVPPPAPYGERQSALKRWLDQGYQAEMTWMTDERRQQIEAVLPGVQSVICLALNYYTPHQHRDESGLGKISRYAWGRDYHRVLEKRLKALGRWLREQVSESQCRWYADTGPIQDKVWAELAGLGWIAKNGNLITRQYGSWVFLGEVLTTLALEPDTPHTAHCGSCRRCLDACPTGAIPEPFVVDANRCIAYHTIENRAAELPGAIAQSLNGWVAGCDICQDVCPWNHRFAQPTDVADFEPYPWNLAPHLEDLAQLSAEDWDQRFLASALRRIQPAMWRRNAWANLTSPQKELD